MAGRNVILHSLLFYLAADRERRVGRDTVFYHQAYVVQINHSVTETPHWMACFHDSNVFFVIQEIISGYDATHSLKVSIW